jgi:hypothetical protein
MLVNSVASGLPLRGIVKVGLYQNMLLVRYDDQKKMRISNGMLFAVIVFPKELFNLCKILW